MVKKETYLNTIEESLSLLSSRQEPTYDVLTDVYYRTITLVENLYGSNNIRISKLTKTKDILIGQLKAIKSDIEKDLISNLEKQTIGSVVADFISLAKSSAEDGNKDVASVLAAAAIEDSLKRYGMLNELQVDDKDMSEVINALKAKGLLKGPQASIVTSYTKLRNKAFHAEWDKIEMADVKSLIGFTEGFILKNLS